MSKFRGPKSVSVSKAERCFQMRFLISSFLLLFCMPAFAQIKVDGDHTATVGYMLKIKLTQLDVDDPQIRVFPDNPDWMAVKDLSGQSFILYVPGKKTLSATETSKLITFVIAGNKANKTYVVTHEVTVTPDGDIPGPGPAPGPTPDESIRQTSLYKTLHAAYLTSPNTTAKANLLKVYNTFLTDIKADKFKSNGEAVDSLVKVTTSLVGSDLKPVRDGVADYFMTAVGTSRKAWDKAKLQAAVEKVVACVGKIPD